MRAHLEQVAKQTGKRPKDLEEPPVPPGMERVWGAFLDLASVRGGNGFAPLPIGWADIAAYDRLMERGLRPWEVAVIRRLDAAALAAMGKPKS
ncbi:phage tail assembly chaperone [Salinarimonas sp. NSM]|uniref:phage tail assembly chaperone n=1 Tax=Salinarimonas sp. NSM TaxID=3458003 RepID=UPI0040354056